MSLDAIIRDTYLPQLLARNIIKKTDIDKILKEADIRKEPIVTYITKQKIVSDKDVESFLSDEMGFLVIDPTTVEIRKEVVALIEKAIAKKYLIVPFDFEDDVLMIATANPMDIVIFDDLRALLGYGIKPFCALPHKIEQVYKELYEQEEVGKDADIDIEEIMAEAVSDDLEVVESKREGDFTDLLQAADETPIIKITNLILMEGVKRKASDIFIEPWEKHMSVRCRVDGLLESMKAPPKSMANSIASRIKVLSHLDIAERRIPQDGRFRIKYQDRFVEFRVSILPSSFGEKVCLRILDKTTQAQAIEKLGFTELEMEKIKEAAIRPHGMLLVTGPTGSGKTSTLYSILNFLDSPDKNITTVEDPVEYQIYGINQVHIREAVGLTFSASLRSILRQDPDIIMVGEIRDFVTMDIAIKAALTGHLVLSTLHTNDACGSIVRITNMGIEPFLIASSLLMVSAQRLIRKLCSECKEAYVPSETVLQSFFVPPAPNIHFYKPVGCEHCRGTGYSGRTVITEVLPISATIRELVMKKATGEDIKQMGRKEGMQTLRESGVCRVRAGISSVEEVLRVTTADQEIRGIKR
jgi:type IV pilus assembly protein PilB